MTTTSSRRRRIWRACCIKVPDEVSPRRSAPSAGGIWWSSPAGSGGSWPARAIPECNFTMPLVVEMPGRCPKCGGRLLKRTGTSRKSGKQYTYYCCEHTNNRVRRRRDLRFHDLGRAGEGRLPGLRPDHVQEGRPGLQAALLHQSGVRQLPAGGQAGLSQEASGGGHRANAEEAPERERSKPAEEKARQEGRCQKRPQPRPPQRKPPCKKTAKKAEDGDAEKKPAAKKAAAKKAAAKTTTKKTTAKKTTKKSRKRDRTGMTPVPDPGDKGC